MDLDFAYIIIYIIFVYYMFSLSYRNILGTPLIKCNKIPGYKPSVNKPVALNKSIKKKNNNNE